jgi:hypothetical protein
VNPAKNLMPYRKERALEDTAFGHGCTPARLFSLLLPVWQVDVRAETVEGKPYELIDRYLERGIAEAGLGTVAELAAFFALDEPLVDRAVRFLVGIGHLAGDPGGRLVLTELGLASHRDKVRYVSVRQDRRRLYFDGFASRPLHRRHYDSGAVTFLTSADVHALSAGRDRDFRLFATTRGFRRETLAELSRCRDRDRYNLPYRLDRPESLGEDGVFLPVYLVRAVAPGGGTRFLAYGQAAGTADPELSELCERSEAIRGTLANEDAPEEEQKTRIVRWLDRKGLPGHRPVRQPHGGWQVVLPVAAFEPRGPVPRANIGSFTALSTTVVRIWCEDEGLREQALFERLESFLKARQRQGDSVAALAAKVGRQLGFEPLDRPALRAMAAAAGRDVLGALLDGLD